MALGSTTIPEQSSGTSEGGMVERRVGLLRWVVLGLALAILASSSVAGVIWYRTRSRRLELAEARAAMEAGRFGMVREHLVRLADRWPDDGEILLLLGECELEPRTSRDRDGIGNRAGPRGRAAARPGRGDRRMGPGAPGQSSLLQGRTPGRDQLDQHGQVCPGRENLDRRPERAGRGGSIRP